MPRGRDWVAGEQLAQVDNRDPFAPPVWRSPVYRTPEPVIMIVQLIRLIWRVLRKGSSIPKGKPGVNLDTIRARTISKTSFYWEK